MSKTDNVTTLPAPKKAWKRNLSIAVVAIATIGLAGLAVKSKKGDKNVIDVEFDTDDNTITL